MSAVTDWLDRNADNLALTVVSIVVGVLVSLYFFRKQERPKTLDWAILSSYALTPNVSGGDLPLELDVTWKGPMPWARSPSGDQKPRKLVNARVVNLRIQNTGKQPR